MRSFSLFSFFSFVYDGDMRNLEEEGILFMLGGWMNEWFMLCFMRWAGGDICPAVGLRFGGLWDMIKFL